jgi:anti-sigma B factor antagonist
MREVSDLVVRTATAGGRTTIWLRGDLDLATSDELRVALEKAVEAGAEHVTVDLSEVSFLDSMGIGSLLIVHRLGAALTLRHPVPDVRNVLEITGIPTVAIIEGA